VLGHTLTDLGGTFFTHADYPFNVRGYRFDPYVATIPLGVLATTDVVEYVMQARVSGPGFETGGRAVIGDPFDLAGSGSSITFAAQVPEPSSWFMLGLGLMLLAGAARRRRRRAIERRQPSRRVSLGTITERACIPIPPSRPAMRKVGSA